jgi:hypothetical protein
MAEGIKIDAEEFKEYYRAISKIDVELGKAMGKRMRQLAKPIVEEVRAAVLATPAGRSAGATRAKKGSTLGLRAAIAASTKADINKTGKGAAVHIRVSKSKMASIGGRPVSVAYYYEGRKANWRHPIFGRRANSEDWATQAAHPFLAKTVYPHREKFATEIIQILEETLNKLPKQ